MKILGDPARDRPRGGRETEARGEAMAEVEGRGSEKVGEGTIHPWV